MFKDIFLYVQMEDFPNKAFIYIYERIFIKKRNS